MDIVERLRAVAEEGYTFAGEAADEIERLRAELAAAHAVIAQLHEVLNTVDAYNTRAELWHAVQAARAIPRDDTALRARLKAERERCAVRADCFDKNVAEAIRALGDE